MWTGLDRLSRSSSVLKNVLLLSSDFIWSPSDRFIRFDSGGIHKRRIHVRFPGYRGSPKIPLR